MPSSLAELVSLFGLVNFFIYLPEVDTWLCLSARKGKGKGKENCIFVDLHFILGNQVMVSGQNHCCFFLVLWAPQTSSQCHIAKTWQITPEQSTWAKGKKYVFIILRRTIPFKVKQTVLFFGWNQQVSEGKFKLRLRTLHQEKPGKKIYFEVQPCSLYKKNSKLVYEE